MSTTTARRRWSREMDLEVDGTSFNGSGPALVHGYDPPAGGMWVDDVIPGKLGVFDRNSGEEAWMAPCEIGYGRGFGAGFIDESELAVLGPSQQGHRIVRMSREDGRLLSANTIDAFDEALVGEDVCVCVSAKRVFGVDTREGIELWSHAKSGERYHTITRIGGEVFVVYTHRPSKRQGVFKLKAGSGRSRKSVLDLDPRSIHRIAAEPDGVVLLTENIAPLLSVEGQIEYMERLAEQDEMAAKDSQALLVLDPATEVGQPARWFEVLSTEKEPPEIGLRVNEAKVYIARDALLQVRDLLSGRALGQWVVPGLDERVDWRVGEGACLVAEENRVSVFELPA